MHSRPRLRPGRSRPAEALASETPLPPPSNGLWSSCHQRTYRTISNVVRDKFCNQMPPMLIYATYICNAYYACNVACSSKCHDQHPDPTSPTPPFESAAWDLLKEEGGKVLPIFPSPLSLSSPSEKIISSVDNHIGLIVNIVNQWEAAFFFGGGGL